MSTRIPPHSVEYEQALLGCILLDPVKAISEVSERIGKDLDAFYDLRHKNIFEAMMDLHAAGLPINVVTVLEKLKSRGQLEACGGAAYLSALPDATPTAHEAGYYADQLSEKSALRKIITACTKAVVDAYEAGTNLEDLLSETEKQILAIRRQKADKTPGVATLVSEALDEMQRLYEKQGAISGQSTGYPDLDSLTDGLHPGEMIVIAGYPGAGKSTFAVNVAEHVAIDTGHPVGIFSLEMSAKRLVFRMLASRGRVNLRSIKRGDLSERDFKGLTVAGASIKGAPFHFCDASDLSIFQLRSKARQMQQAHNIKLLVVDYLQLLTAPGKKDQSREQEVSMISRGLKMMACELGIPVLALSQLNDDGKLRESRAIGQDADGIWVLRQKDGQEPEANPAQMILDIKKQRDGQSPAFVELTFMKSNVRFESTSKIGPDDHKY